MDTNRHDVAKEMVLRLLEGGFEFTEWEGDFLRDMRLVALYSPRQGFWIRKTFFKYHRTEEILDVFDHCKNQRKVKILA